MQILKHIGLILLWFVGPVFAFAAANKNDPYLISLRGPGNVALAAASIIAVVILIRRGYWRRGVAGGAHSAVVPAIGVDACSACYVRVAQAKRSADRRCAGTKPWPALRGGILVIPRGGCAGREGADLRRLITRHNIVGSTVERLREEISALQARRRAAGLPPLIVAADQEGGIVSHLAPPLSKLPALSTLAGLAPDVRDRKAEEFGRIHGQELAALGVNQNLAPVLDLRPDLKRNRFDFNTLIGQRAISDDPATVADIARAYVRGLEASGVGATVKHFPGLVPTIADE